MALDPENKRIDWEMYAGKDAEWWRSQEARALADRIVSYQQPDGGWRKTMEEEVQDEWLASTIDNGATWSQVRYLAKSHAATGEQNYRESCMRGIEFLLASQHESGGWPQIPGASGTYHAHITFNDDATTEVMRLMRDIAAQSETERRNRLLKRGELLESFVPSAERLTDEQLRSLLTYALQQESVRAFLTRITNEPEGGTPHEEHSHL